MTREEQDRCIANAKRWMYFMMLFERSREVEKSLRNYYEKRKSEKNVEVDKEES